jgi:colicin import membrane protein/protein TonB
MTASALESSPLVSHRERLWPAVLASVAIHAALIAFAVAHRGPPPVNLNQKPIVAKLVRLGQKRPEQWLPRKDAAPPPPAAASPGPPAPAPRAQAAPRAVAVPIPKAVAKAPAPAAPKGPAPAANPRGGARGAGRSDVLASVMSRMRSEKAGEDPIYGDPSGDPMGDAEEASAGDQYLALVERALRESYTLPSTISERDRMYLKATVVLYVDDDGKVLRYAFETRSGNAAFDSALERAIRAARLPPPPPELRRKYRSEGLGVLYRP